MAAATDSPARIRLIKRVGWDPAFTAERVLLVPDEVSADRAADWIRRQIAVVHEEEITGNPRPADFSDAPVEPVARPSVVITKRKTAT